MLFLPQNPCTQAILEILQRLPTWRENNHACTQSPCPCSSNHYISVAPIAIVAAGLMVGQGSNAAFSSSTRNPGNSWSTGSGFAPDTSGPPTHGV